MPPKSLGPLKPIWRFFGADEPNYAYMKDGKKLLGQLGKLGKPQTFFRTHNLLTSGDGTPALKWGSTNAYTEDAQGNPVYDWTILDRIFDAYLKNKRQALRPDRLHARGALRPGRSPISIAGRPEPSTTRSTPAGRFRRRTTTSGASWSTAGRNTASSVTARPRSRAGGGRPGTSPTSATGAARPRSSTDSTTSASPPFVEPCPRRASAARTSRAAATSS